MMASMISYRWLENISNIITITASTEAKIKVTFKQRGSSVAFQKISEEPVYRNDGIWEIVTTLEEGEYLVKVDVVDGKYEESITSLVKVYNAEEFNSVVGFETLTAQVAALAKIVDNLKTTVSASKSFKTAG